MPAKIRKSRTISIPRKSSPPIAEGEIDVLKFMVRSTLARDLQKRKTLTEVSFGDVRIDFVRHELFKNGKQLEANAREFQLLQYFLQHEGEVVSRDQLLADVWGFENIPNTRSVDNYILSLRKKIETDSAQPRHILTFRGAGYKFLR
jgi:DNA-binding response OmpR family regulator